MVLELQRLKAKEQAQIGWTAKRELAKINYRIHTDAIKSHLIPTEVTKEQANIIQGERLIKLNQIAIQQMRVLSENEGRKLLK